jgi:competence protein ComEC
MATLKGGLRSQTIATLGLAPLSMVFFQQISLVGFAANLVAIPLVTLLVTPLALLGVLLPPLWTLAALVAQGLMAYLAALASLPLAVWTAAAAPGWAVAAGLLGALLGVLPLPWRLRLLGVPLVLPLLFPPVERPPPGGFEVVAADIGQGTAVLVRTARHLLVYDTGPQYSPEADAGQRVLLPLLRARGEAQVDLLMLSHRDSDHVGGAASLMAGVPVRALRSSLEDVHALRQRGIPHRRCEAGQRWDWDGVQFEVLHPTPAEHESATKSNAVSCVLRVVGRTTSLLLTGDIEAPQEAALLARGAELHADVLLVPHHGSRTSSTPAFIEAVAPHTAVVQAGYRSRFHHPQPDIVERYTARGIALVRSDRCGAWTLAADGSATCERQAARRYWHHGGSPVDN